MPQLSSRSLQLAERHRHRSQSPSITSTTNTTNRTTTRSLSTSRSQQQQRESSIESRRLFTTEQLAQKDIEKTKLELKQKIEKEKQRLQREEFIDDSTVVK